MINLQMVPIFLPYDSGNSAPMTENDVKVLIGIFIVWNIITLLLVGYTKLIEKEDLINNGLTFLATGITLCMWGIIGITFLGVQIAKFL